MKKTKLDILKKQGTGFKTPQGYFDMVEDTVISEISLNALPSNAGYATPKNYFDTVEEQILEKVDVIGVKSLEQFDIPKNYFDTLEDRVFDKIQQEDAKQPKVIHLKTRLVKIIAPIAVAASLLFIFILNYNKNGESYSFDDLAASDVENWIEKDLITLESYAIAEVFDDVTLEEELNDDDLEILDYINGTDIESALLTD
jgi:hypothetical protein